MEVVGLTPAFWRGRRVLVTGHTGFKGSWLALWLRELGADVTGFALAPPTQPSLYATARVAEGIHDLRGDVRDAAAVRAALADSRPEVIFHLAAQALVRESYRDPLGTFATNVMGTAHVLDAARQSSATRAIVVVTSDKCYANDDAGVAFREDHPLGGFDPYSSSKACAELVSAAYRSSFLAASGAAVATVRAGNVIGGGDWSADRLLPDAIRAWTCGAPVRLRHPAATRPWQHVLEPLAGCLGLAARLCEDGQRFAGPWNLGPSNGAVHPVVDLIRTAAEAWGAGAVWERDPGAHPHEVATLALDAGKAASELGWRTAWPLERAVRETVLWHRALDAGRDAQTLTLAQIESYQHDINGR